MSLDTTIPPLALTLIAKYGKTITYTRVTQGAYDPATGLTSAGAAATTMKALVEDYQKQADGAAFVNGLVLEGDKKITAASKSFTAVPVPGDRVTVETNVLTVKNVKTTYAGEVAALYELHVRT
jgi:hypothetical protein